MFSDLLTRPGNSAATSKTTVGSIPDSGDGGDANELLTIYFPGHASPAKERYRDISRHAETSHCRPLSREASAGVASETGVLSREVPSDLDLSPGAKSVESGEMKSFFTDEGYYSKDSSVTSPHSKRPGSTHGAFTRESRSEDVQKQIAGNASYTLESQLNDKRGPQSSTTISRVAPTVNNPDIKPSLLITFDTRAAGGNFRGLQRQTKPDPQILLQGLVIFAFAMALPSVQDDVVSGGWIRQVKSENQTGFGKRWNHMTFPFALNRLSTFHAWVAQELICGGVVEFGMS
ncbi:hypothetical protein QFC24_000807 [Naganishia onofrii]|uniref:Uncharacterized protein n=1 Tax=Naganishia onofrii TaxID=1851511 RepID=A0ACC2XUW3_9TREE|nr:hypothetical protein QFC24_000807 [Naganishia onofrii]